MRHTNGTGGLCMTCNNVPGCYHHARRGPALFCELFDNYDVLAKRSAVGRALRSTDSITAVAVPKTDSGRYSGLCVNCRHRSACMHPKPADGVWHCEDYD